MIGVITEKARAMMIDSQAPLEFWGEAVDTAVYLHRLTPNEGLTKRDDRDGYKAAYETPYGMLHAYDKPAIDANGKKISYKVPLHHLRRFGCFVSRLIPESQLRDKFGPRSKPGCMMVGYDHNFTTRWRVWDPEFKKVCCQSEVIFDEDRNAHISCPQEHAESDIFGLPQEEVHIEEIDQNVAHSDRNRDHEHAHHTGTGNRDHERAHHTGTGNRNHECAHHTGTGNRDHKRAHGVDHHGQEAAQLHTETRPITRSMATASTAEANIVMHALTSIATDGDPSTYEEAMNSPQRAQWQVAIREECTSILQNDTFASESESKPRIKPIGSKWVFKTKTNPDGSIQHKARLVIKDYMQPNWGDTYAPVGKLTTFRYLISMAASHGLAIDHLDIVTAFLNPEVDDPDYI